MPISSNSPNSISLNIGASVSGAVEVTSSAANPVHVTGAVQVQGISFSGGITTAENSVAAVGGPVPSSATFIGGTDATGTLRGFKVDSSGNLLISGDISVSPSTGTQQVTGTVHVDNPVTSVTVSNLPATQSVFVVNQGTSSFAGDVNITASIPLQVTSSQDNPVWVTGTDLAVSIKNSTVVLSASLASTAGTGVLAPSTATLAGYVDQAGNLVPATVIGGAQIVNITGAMAVVDPGNSTTALLGGNASFTGSSVDTLGYASIAYNLISDVTGAVDGIQIQFSPDNTNWETLFSRTYGTDRVGSNTDLIFRPHERYFRLIYKNGAAAQGTFRLQTILARYSPQGDTVGVDRNVSAGQDALVVKAVIAGKSLLDGNYHDVQLDVNNALQVAGIETLTDGITNPSNVLMVGGLGMVWDPVGQVWNRLVQGDADADGDAGPVGGLLMIESYNKVFNGISWDRMRGDTEGNFVKIAGTGSGGLAVSQSNLPATQSVYVVNAQGSDVRITGSTVTLSVSQTNVPATQSVFVVNSQGSDVQITGSTVTLPVSMTNPVLTASISNFPVTQVVTASLASPVSVSQVGTVTVSQSNVPAGVVTVSQSNVPAGVLATSQSNVPAGTQTVSMSNWPAGATVSQSNIPAGAFTVTSSLASPVTVAVSGIAGVSQSNIPAGTMNVTGTVGVWNTVTVSQSNPVLTASVSVSNFPASQTVTGSVGVWNTVAVSQSNIPAGTITVSQSNPVLTASVSVSNFPASQTVTGSVGVWNTITVSQSNLPAGTVQVTSSNANPVWITGVLTTVQSASGTFFVTEASVGGIGQQAPISATLIGAHDTTGNLSTLHTDAQSNLYVTMTGILGVSQSNVPATQSVFVVNAQGSNVQITGSTVTLAVSQTNPVLTASVSVSNFPASQAVTGTVGVWNTVAVSQTLPITASISNFPTVQQVSQSNIPAGTVTVSQSNPVLTASVSVSNFPASQTVTGSVGVWNTVGVSQSNIPAGTVTVSMSNPVTTASISNFPAGFNVNVTASVTQSVTGTVGVWNMVTTSQSNIPAGTLTVSQSNIPAGTLTVSQSNPVTTASISNFPTGFNVNLTSSITQSVTGTVGVWNVVQVSQSNPVLTASVSVSNFPATQTVTGSVGVWNTVGVSQSNIPAGTVTVSQSNPVLTASVSVSNFPATQTVTGTVGVWNSVQVSQSNVPAGTVTVSQTNPVLTASVSVSNFPATQTVTGSVGVWNTITVSQSNLPAGTVTVSQSNPVLTASVSVSNFPVTQAVTGSVGIWNAVTVSQSNPVLTASVSVSNFPATQTITGSVGVWNTVAVSQSNPVLTSSVNVANFPAGFNVNLTSSITQSVTGTVHLDNNSLTSTLSLDDLPRVAATISAQGQVVTAALGGAAGIAFGVSGTFSGSIRCEASWDEGNSWYRLEMYNPYRTIEAVVGTITASGPYIPYNIAGATHVRASASTWTSGQADLYIHGNRHSTNIQIDVRENGETSPEYGSMIGGDDNGIFRFLKVNQSGAMLVTSSYVTPLWVTGVITTVASASGTFVAIENSVGGTGQLAPASATFVAGYNASNLIPFKVDPEGALYTVANATGTNVQITGATVTLTVSQSNVPQGVHATSQSNIPAGTFPVTATISSPVSVAMVGALSAVFSGIQNVTGSVGVWNALTGTMGVWNIVQTSQSNIPAGTVTVSMSNAVLTASVSVSNFPATQTVTGTVGVWNAVQVSQSNTPAGTQTVSMSNWPAGATVSQSNIPAGTFTVSQSNIPAGAFTVTGSVGVWNTLTGTVGVWNTVGTSQSNIPAGTVTVSQSNPVLTASVSVSNFPASQTVTGSVGVWNAVQVSQSNVPAGTFTVSASLAAPLTVALSGTGTVTGTVGVWNALTGTVGVWNAVQVSQSNVPAGTQTVSQSNIPAGAFTVTSTLAAPATVAVSGTASVSMSAFPAGTVTVSQSNWPAGATGTFGVWNTVTVSQSNTPAGVQTVTATLANPATVAVTGILAVSQTNPSSGGGVQYATGTATPSSGTIALAVSGTTAVALSASNVSGALWVQIPQSQVVAVSQTNALNLGVITVTSSLANPVWTAISGVMTVAFSGTQAVTGTVHIDNSGSGNAVWVTGTVVTSQSNIPAGTYTVSQSNIPAGTFQVSQSNIPAGTYTVTATLAAPATVALSGTGTITGSVGVWNALTGTVGVWNALTGTVGVWNAVQVSQSNTPAGTQTVSQSNIPAGAFTITSTLAAPATVALSGTGTVTGTVGVWNALTGTVGVWNALTGTIGVWNVVQVSQSNTPAGTQTVSQSNVPAGAFTVTSTLASPATVALSGTGTITGSVGVWNTLTGTVGVWNALTGTVGVWNTVTVSQSNQPAGTVTVTSSQASPVWITQSGGGSSVSVTNTASITASSANPVSVAIIGAISAQNPAAVTTGSNDIHSGSVTLGVYNNTAQYFSASSIGYLGVTATLDNPVTVALSGGIAATITGVMTVTATTDAPISVAIVGASPGGGTQYATGTATTGGSGTLFLAVNAGNAQYLSATNLGALLITGTVSQSNVPAGVFQVSQSNTPAGTQTVSMSNWPAGAVVSQSNTPAGTQTVSMSNWPAGATFSQSNMPAGTGTYALPASNTPTVTAVSVVGTGGVTILAANQNRLGATIQNIATGSAGITHVKLGSSPTLGSYTVRIAQNGYYEVPFNYKGVITAICSASITASVLVTEITA